MEMHTAQSLKAIHGIDVNARIGEVQVLSFLKDLIVRIGQRVRDEVEYRKAEAALMELSDEHLRDMGIARCEIETKVRKGRHRR
jgi:uncharacterized protein YjiS (DUF1127 family)